MGDAKAQVGRRGRGFRRASNLVQSRIRKAGETRGFAVTRLLTHWPEIVGDEIAAMARPVKVSYGRGFGASLTVLTTGASAQLVQMQLPRIVERVNACYGYAAIATVRVTQTAPEGFGEAAADFRAPGREGPAPEAEAQARDATTSVCDPGLRAALEALGRNVLSRKH